MEKNMDDLNEIFASDIQGRDLDTELAAASEMLEKMAAAEGVDLSALSDADVAELLSDLMPSKLAAEDEEHETKAEEKAEAKRKEDKKEEKKASMSLPDGITYADVAAELAKYAQANEIDLSQVSRAAYHEAFDKLAASMGSPEYEAAKVAAAEEQAKLAEADHIGRVMARSFMDEQSKIALSDEEKAFHKTRMQMNMNKPGETNPARHSAKDATKAQGKAKAEERLARIKGNHGPMGKVQRAVDTVKLRGHLAGKEIADAARKHPGKAGLAVAGGLAAAGGAAYGAKKLHDKAAADAEALELARDFLREKGIDPDSGEKVASDEVITRANEMLRENGWID